MNDSQLTLLKSIGINIHSIRFDQQAVNVTCLATAASSGITANEPIEVVVRGEFTLDTDKFNAMADYLCLVRDAVNSDNPTVNDLLEQLKITMKLIK